MNFAALLGIELLNQSLACIRKRSRHEDIDLFNLLCLGPDPAERKNQEGQHPQSSSSGIRLNRRILMPGRNQEIPFALQPSPER